MLKLTKKYKFMKSWFEGVDRNHRSGKFLVFQKLESLSAFSNEREVSRKRLNICYFLQNTSDY